MAAAAMWSRENAMDKPMVRMTDLPAGVQQHLAGLECPRFDTRPWVRGGPLAARRVAIVSSAGLIVRGDKPVMANDVRYRAIPHDTPAGDILMSHVSVNYDRTGFQRDINVAFPRDRLAELAADGVIGAVAQNHYATMGAVDPVGLEEQTRTLAGVLQREGVDSALLLPV
jgi:D-proline reductase (dithiol) PrdB